MPLREIFEVFSTLRLSSVSLTEGSLLDFKEKCFARIEARYGFSALCDLQKVSLKNLFKKSENVPICPSTLYPNF